MCNAPIILAPVGHISFIPTESFSPPSTYVAIAFPLAEQKLNPYSLSVSFAFLRASMVFFLISSLSNMLQCSIYFQVPIYLFLSYLPFHKSKGLKNSGISTLLYVPLKGLSSIIKSLYHTGLDGSLTIAILFLLFASFQGIAQILSTLFQGKLSSIHTKNILSHSLSSLTKCHSP